MRWRRSAELVLAVDDGGILVAAPNREVAAVLLEGGGAQPNRRPSRTPSTQELNETVGWFADQRLLDVGALREVEWPGALDSLRNVTTIAIGALGSTARSCWSVVRRGGATAAAPAPLPSAQSALPVGTDETAMEDDAR